MNKSLYEDIGVSVDANEEEIKTGFKNKAKECHPDKNGGNGSKMTALNHAYSILKDPIKRNRYDSTGEEFDTPFDVKFGGLVQDIFLKIIDGVDSVEHVDLVGRFLEILGDIIKGNQQLRVDLNKKRVKLKKVCDRLVIKSGDGKIVSVLENNLENMKLEMALMDEQIEFFKKANEVVGHYDYKFEPEPVKPMESNFIDWNIYGRKF